MPSVQVARSDEWTRPQRGKPLLLPAAQRVMAAGSSLPVRAPLQRCTCALIRVHGTLSHPFCVKWFGGNEMLYELVISGSVRDRLVATDTRIHGHGYTRAERRWLAAL